MFVGEEARIEFSGTWSARLVNSKPVKRTHRCCLGLATVIGDVAKVVRYHWVSKGRCHPRQLVANMLNAYLASGLAQGGGATLLLYSLCLPATVHGWQR